MIYHFNYYYFPHNFFHGPIFMIIIWAIIIWAIIRLVKHFSKHTNSKTNSLIDVLRERYVKGEISKEKFEEMKKDIQ